ncbi:hypothetical protein JHK85_023499 [Glycine max]|nr:hypothetical protein JHK85_023499 [Glycine max]
MELDLECELVSSVTVLGTNFNLEYKGLHLICFHCGKYGHKDSQCLFASLTSGTTHQLGASSVWVRIPMLPMELYNSEFLYKVGDLLGTTLKIDVNMPIQNRGKFARICVELDLECELVPSVTVLGMDFNLEYEGLHLICFHCGKYGHSDS